MQLQGVEVQLSHSKASFSSGLVDPGSMPGWFITDTAIIEE